MGQHQVKRFLTNLNLPGMSDSALKKREREVMDPIKKVARCSLDDSLEEEKNASKQLRYVHVVTVVMSTNINDNERTDRQTNMNGYCISL